MIRLGLVLLLTGCSLDASAGDSKDKSMAPIPEVKAGEAVAVIAGGCFWCIEKDFDKLDGVVSTTSGYAGGSVDKPNYTQVGMGLTGHAEALRIVYDTKKLSYEKVLDYFWHHVDPTDAGGQFCDRGSQYRSAIFAQDDAQKAAADKSKADLVASGVIASPIVTEVVLDTKFWAAEVYHQDFYKKDPERYNSYRMGCGRDKRVKEVWGTTH